MCSYLEDSLKLLHRWSLFDVLEKRTQCFCIFKRLTCALALRWQHWMRSIANQEDATAMPGAQWILQSIRHEALNACRPMELTMSRNCHKPRSGECLHELLVYRLSPALKRYLT